MCLLSRSRRSSLTSSSSSSSSSFSSSPMSCRSAILRPPTQKLGRWVPHRVKGRNFPSDRSPANKPDHEFRMKKKISKAKERHNLDVMRKNLSKFPEIILAEKLETLKGKLETKKGLMLFLPSWQQEFAKERRDRYRKKYRFDEGENTVNRFEELHSLRTIEFLQKEQARIVAEKNDEFVPDI
eukprot:TRINITY_DN325_c1_g1_i4.p2 TRINITY_DN325_c1_g1~~TRINITY_DN325_c1_g1_i4.p2  ORF type:complete len:183 (-),score=59.03 TRINITY_DN325_c1_g1_i4:223-771(-)